VLRSICDDVGKLVEWIVYYFNYNYEFLFPFVGCKMCLPAHNYVSSLLDLYEKKCRFVGF